MALLQNDKAVFYHPLDDAVEYLKTKTWTGTGTFGTGKISNSLNPVEGSLGFGSEAEFLSASYPTSIYAAKLDSTRFVVVYGDNPASDSEARVATASGSSVTLGASTVFLSGTATTYVEATALSSTKFAVGYRKGGAGHAAAKIGTVSGTDITFGAETTFNTDDHSSVALRALDSTKFVFLYQKVITFGRAHAKVATVSGTDITVGAESGEMNGSTTTNARLAKLSSTKVASSCRTAAGGFVSIGTISGTDITWGTEISFVGGGITHWDGLAALSSTTIVVAYTDGGGSYAKVGTVSGTDVTFGAAAQIVTGNGTGQAAEMSSTKFVVTYRDVPDSGHGTAKIGTVSGTGITFDAGTEFLSAGGASRISVAVMGSGSFGVAYQDEADSNHGTVKIGDIPSSAARTGLTADYDSAAAATKVAFAGWLKNPSA